MGAAGCRPTGIAGDIYYCVCTHTHTPTGYARTITAYAQFGRVPHRACVCDVCVWFDASICILPQMLFSCDACTHMEKRTGARAILYTTHDECGFSDQHQWVWMHIFCMSVCVWVVWPAVPFRSVSRVWWPLSGIGFCEYHCQGP